MALYLDQLFSEYVGEGEEMPILGQDDPWNEYSIKQPEVVTIDDCLNPSYKPPMPNNIQHANELGKRQVFDTNAFMHNDKFETFLDLTDAIKVRNAARACTNYKDFRSAVDVGSLPNDTFAEMEVSGLSLAEIASCSVTPTVVSTIILDALTITGGRSHLKSETDRRLKTMAVKASQLALNVQMSHLTSKCNKEFQDIIDQSGFDRMHNKLSGVTRAYGHLFDISEDFMMVLRCSKDLCVYVEDKKRIGGYEGAKLRARKRMQLINSYTGNGFTCNIPSLDGSVIVFHDFAILSFQRRKYLLNKPMLLELINKVNELECVMVYAFLQSGVIFPDNHHANVARLLKHWSSVVQRYADDVSLEEDMSYANKGFVYLKAIEGLGVAELIRRGDQEVGWDNVMLWDTLWASLQAERLVSQQHWGTSTLFRIWEGMTEPEIAECLGLVKLCGHPSIEIQRGLDQLNERTHENLDVNPVFVNRGIGVLTRDLILGYYRRHKKYPNINPECLPHCNENLRLLITRQLPPTEGYGLRLFKSVTAAEWSRIVFGKVEEFDTIDNQLPLLKDKALGITRSKVFTHVLAEIGKGGAQSLGVFEERRMLLAYMLNPSFDQQFRMFLQEYMQDEEWSRHILNYLVIKLTSKELEEKPQGRMFGSSPPFYRNTRIVQEYNVMKLMDNYIPDQLMTPDELQMIKKLYSFRSFGTLFPNHTMIQVSFDFSKWNNSMRHESVDIPAGHILDNWFGTSLFKKTMIAYQKSLIYYKDRHRQDHWMGQLGGIEGLNQATWSFVFIGGIKQALEALGLTYHLTVKGDDVRAAIAIPNHLVAMQGYDDIRDQILGQLTNLCTAMGWTLNPQESFVSTTVICTSKQYQMKDTWLPASEKKMAKIKSLSNLIFPTTEDVIASIFSTAHSACAQTTAVIPAYATALYFASREMMRAFGPTIINELMLTSLLLWPQIIGGPGALPLQTFFVRGENDMLSVTISLLRFVLVTDPSGLAQYITRILSQAASRKPNPAMLVSDPYSIPIKLPERPKSVLKKLTRQHLIKWVRNTSLRRLLNARGRRDREQFIQHLFSMVPYFAKVCTVLWENSPFYIIEEVLSRFMESSTVFAFFSRGQTGFYSKASAHRMLRRILIASDTLTAYWKRTLLFGRRSRTAFLGVATDVWMNTSVCTTKIVHLIREALWGRKIEGITYPSLVDQNYVVCGARSIGDHDYYELSPALVNVEIRHKFADFQTSLRSHHYASCRGVIPWLGAQTSTKLVFAASSSTLKSVTNSKILKLLNLKMIAQRLGAQLRTTILEVIKSLTGVDTDILDVIQPESGASNTVHRLACNAYSLSTMPNTRPNMQQIVVWPNNSGGALHGDPTDRTVNFAARCYYVTSLMLIPLQWGMLLPPDYPEILYTCYHWDSERTNDLRQVCPWCCNIVEDRPVIFEIPLLTDMGYYQNLPLVGTSEYDEHILRINMVTNTEGRARKILNIQNLPDRDPVLIEFALMVILRDFSNNQRDAFDSASALDAHRIPSGQILQVLAPTLGLSSVQQLSMNIIRLCTPTVLYNNALELLLSNVMKYVSLNSESSVILMLPTMQSHLNPMAGVFEYLSSAGVMQLIAEGCRMVNPDIRLEWSAGDFSSGHAMYTRFYQAHVEYLLDIIWRRILRPRPVTFVHMEGPGMMRDKLMNLIYRNQTMLIRSMRWRRGNHSPLNQLKQIIYTVCYRAAGEGNLPWDIPARDLNRQEPPLVSDHDDIEILLHHMADMYFDAEDDIKIDITNLILASRFMTALPPANLDDQLQEWQEGPHRDVRLHPNVHLDEILVQLPDEYYHNPDYPPVATLRDVLTPNEWRWVNGFTNAICLAADVIYLDPIIVAEIDRVLLWMYSWRDVTAVFMSRYDAQTLIQTFPDEARQLLEMELERIPERFPVFQENFAQQPPPQMRCEYDGDGAHLAINVAFDLAIEHGSVPAAYSDLYARGLPEHTRELEAENLKTDPYEITRCVGRTNTSSAKFIIPLLHMGVLRRFTNSIEPFVGVFLADGLGGVTNTFMRLCPNLYGVYNSLYVNRMTNEPVADAHQDYPPIEVLSEFTQTEISARLRWRGLIPGDLTIEEVRNRITGCTNSWGFPVRLITMDADIKWSPTMATVQELWASSLMMVSSICTPDTIVMHKAFIGSHAVMAKFAILFCAMFQHTHVVKSMGSRQRSTEVIWVGWNFRNDMAWHNTIWGTFYDRIHPTFSVNMVAYVNERLSGYTRAMQDYRYTANVQGFISPEYLIEFANFHCFTLSLELYISNANIYIPHHALHFCRLWGDLLAPLQEHIGMHRRLLMGERLGDLRVTRDVPRGRLRIQSATGRVFTRGWKALQLELRRFWRVSLIYAFASSFHTCFNIHAGHADLDMIIRQSLTATEHDMLGVLLPWHASVRLISTAVRQYLHSDHWLEDLTAISFDVSKKMFQMLGSYAVLCMQLPIQDDRLPDWQEIMRRYHSHTDMALQCCRPQSVLVSRWVENRYTHLTAQPLYNNQGPLAADSGAWVHPIMINGVWVDPPPIRRVYIIEPHLAPDDPQPGEAPIQDDDDYFDWAEEVDREIPLPQ